MFTKQRLLLLAACIAVAAGVFARGGLNSTPTVARAQTTPPTPLCTALATDAAYARRRQSGRRQRLGNRRHADRIDPDSHRRPCCHTARWTW